MRRWETFTALGAAIAAGIGALPFPDHLVVTGVALAQLFVVGGARLYAALTGRRAMRSDAAERAARIREQRRRR